MAIKRIFRNPNALTILKKSVNLTKLRWVECFSCISKAIFDCAWVVVNLINLLVARVLKNQHIVDVVLNLLK